MKKPPSFLNIFSGFFFLCLFCGSSKCQQEYINNLQIRCSGSLSILKGYLCNDPPNSCRSYVTFRSQPPYDTPLSISYLLGSNASRVASINKISNVGDNIPSNNLITVPISCSCSGGICQHLTPYTVKGTQNYFQIANGTYQGLATCQALQGQNYYEYDQNLTAGTQSMAPVRCACPREKQMANGVIALVTYLVPWGDTISSIAKKFGTSMKSTLEANMLSPTGLIFPFTPVLVPKTSESCAENPNNCSCKCSDGYYAERISEVLVCRYESKAYNSSKNAILLGINWSKECWVKTWLSAFCCKSFCLFLWITAVLCCGQCSHNTRLIIMSLRAGF